MGNGRLDSCDRGTAILEGNTGERKIGNRDFRAKD